MSHSAGPGEAGGDHLPGRHRVWGSKRLRHIWREAQARLAYGEPEPEQPPAACLCLTSAGLPAFAHRGHCCLRPGKTCHQGEVAAWARRLPR